MSDDLQKAAAKVDVIDLAGAIIADPVRGTIGASQAGTLALAIAFERAWAVALEADLLVRALRLPFTGDADRDAARDHAIQTQIVEVERLLAPMRRQVPANQETNDGQGQG